MKKIVVNLIRWANRTKLDGCNSEKTLLILLLMLSGIRKTGISKRTVRRSNRTDRKRLSNSAKVFCNI